MTDLVRLCEPGAAYRERFLEILQDYRAAGETKYADMYAPAEQDFDAYLASLRNLACGIDLPAGWVSSSTFWLIDDVARVVGVVRIRHRLTPYLELVGGHIGYDVPPSYRGLGYGNECLRQALERARTLGLDRVMLNCAETNIRSRKVIETCGGRFLDTVISPETGQPERRYWIEIGSPRQR